MLLQKAIWIFPLAPAVHNLEEAIWLPAWSKRAGFWMAPVGTTEFRVAAALLAAIAFADALWAIRAGKQTAGAYVTAGFAFAMLLNVVYHVTASIVLRGYAPGVITAVLINLPVMSYLLLRFFREGWITWPRAVLAFITVPIGILFLIPVLFWVGRSI